MPSMEALMSKEVRPVDGAASVPLSTPLLVSDMKSSLCYLAKNASKLKITIEKDFYVLPDASKKLNGLCNTKHM
jgi:hypothetical protein